MSIFGGGALNVGGHKVSYGLLAAGAGIAGAVLLVIQLRRSGGAIAAGPTTAQGAGVTGSDYSGALANLSQQVGGLQGAITALSAAAPNATAGPAPEPSPPGPRFLGPPIPAPASSPGPTPRIYPNPNRWPLGGPPGGAQVGDYTGIPLNPAWVLNSGGYYALPTPDYWQFKAFSGGDILAASPGGQRVLYQNISHEGHQVGAESPGTPITN